MSLEHLTPAKEALGGQRFSFRASTVLRGTAALAILYTCAVGWNCYQLGQSRGWHARSGLLRSGFATVHMLKEDQVFRFLVGAYVAGKREVNPAFDQKMRHLDFYERETMRTRDEFRYELRRLLVPHF